MRGLILIVVVIAIGIAIVALIWPSRFQALDPVDIGWIVALLAFAALIAIRLTPRRPDGVVNSEGVRGALQPRPLPSAMHGLFYALIWLALLLVLVAGYSVTDWAGRVGRLIGAFFN
ncbi:MAG: hypothetical protein ABUL55_01675 [Pseudomonadota bacterium]